MAQLPFPEQFYMAEGVGSPYLESVLSGPEDGPAPIGQLAAMAVLNKRGSIPPDVQVPQGTVKDRILHGLPGAPPTEYPDSSRRVEGATAVPSGMPPMPPRGMGHGGIVRGYDTGGIASALRGFNEGTGDSTVSVDDDWWKLIFDPTDPVDVAAAGLTLTGGGAAAGIPLKSLNVLRKVRKFLPGGGFGPAIKRGWDWAGGAVGRALGAGRDLPRTMPISPYANPIRNPYRTAAEMAAGKRGLKYGGAGLGAYAANRMGSDGSPVPVGEGAGEVSKEAGAVLDPGADPGSEAYVPSGYEQYLMDMFDQGSSVDQGSSGGMTAKEGLRIAGALMDPAASAQARWGNVFNVAAESLRDREARGDRLRREDNARKLQTALTLHGEESNRAYDQRRLALSSRDAEDEYNRGRLEYIQDGLKGLVGTVIAPDDIDAITAAKNRLGNEYDLAMNPRLAQELKRKDLESDAPQKRARGGLIRGTLGE